VKLFRLPYFFEEVQRLKWVVYDVDAASHKTRVEDLNLANQELLGEGVCTFR
jgi:hypothetical protein